MKTLVAAVAGVVVALGLAGCSEGGSTGADVGHSEVMSTTSPAPTTTTGRESTATTISTQPSAQDSANSDAYTEQAPAGQAPAASPPPFMRPEDYDPYGPPRFVQCWESNAAVMSDGSIVTDTVNCAPAPTAVPPQVGAYDNYPFLGAKQDPLPGGVFPDGTPPVDLGEGVELGPYFCEPGDTYPVCLEQEGAG